MRQQRHGNHHTPQVEVVPVFALLARCFPLLLFVARLRCALFGPFRSGVAARARAAARRVGAASSSRSLLGRSFAAVAGPCAFLRALWALARVRGSALGSPRLRLFRVLSRWPFLPGLVLAFVGSFLVGLLGLWPFVFAALRLGPSASSAPPPAARRFVRPVGALAWSRFLGFVLGCAAALLLAALVLFRAP